MMRMIRGNRLTLLTACLVALTATALWAADTAPAADTGTVSGKVVGTDGNAASGVTVSLMTAKRPAKGERPKPVATATTGDDGSFKIEKVPAGTYTLMAHKDRMRAMKRDVKVTAHQDTAAGELKLAEGRGRGGNRG